MGARESGTAPDNEGGLGANAGRASLDRRAASTPVEWAYHTLALAWAEVGRLLAEAQAEAGVPQGVAP